MSWKDKQGVGSSDSNYVKLETSIIEVGKNVDSSPCFSVYSKEQKTTVNTNKTIVGVYMGSLRSLSGFSNAFGNGVTIRSSKILDKDTQLRLYGSELTKEVLKDFVGNIEEAKAKMMSLKATSIKTVIHVFVLTQKGIVEIKTNATLFYNQFDKIKSMAGDYFIEVSAERYSEDNFEKLDAGFKRLAKSHPPVYANIRVMNDAPITKIAEQEYDIENYFDKWEKYIKYLRTGSSEQEDKLSYEAADMSHHETKFKNTDYGIHQGNQQVSPPPIKEVSYDDLPF